jgi:selenide,water dikinase
MSALSILCYPGKGDIDTLKDILRGGADKMAEAGCVILGGHSVADDEIKFGFAVTGTVHPDRVWTNAGARPGDTLILTKPLGTGVISTALKRGIADPAHVEAAIQSMLTLNRAPACRPRLHRHHRLRPSRPRPRDGARQQGHTRDRRSMRAVPPGAVEYARAGAIPGGSKNNREFVHHASIRTGKWLPISKRSYTIRRPAAVSSSPPPIRRPVQQSSAAVVEYRTKPIRLL